MTAPSRDPRISATRRLLRRALAVLAALAGLGAALHAYAFNLPIVGGAVGPAGTFDSMLLAQLATKPFIWMNQLYDVAKWLFLVLATIEVAWIGAILALEKADLQSWVAAALRKLLVLSIFYAILTNGVKWMASIIGFFTYVGLIESSGGFWAAILTPGALSTDYFNPMAMINRGVETAVHILGLDPSGAPVGAAELGRDPNVFSLRDGIALGVLAMYIGIAAQMFIYFFEMVFVMTAGVLFLGFGGAKFTEQYVMRYLGYGFGVGVKLFVFFMILSVAMPAIDALGSDLRATAAAGQLRLDTALVMGAAVTMLTLLLRSIPSIASSFTTTPGATADSTGSTMFSQLRGPTPPAQPIDPSRSGNGAVDRATQSSPSSGQMMAPSNMTSTTPVTTPPRAPSASAAAPATTASGAPRVPVPQRPS